MQGLRFALWLTLRLHYTYTTPTLCLHYTYISRAPHVSKSCLQPMQCCIQVAFHREMFVCDETRVFGMIARLDHALVISHRSPWTERGPSVDRDWTAWTEIGYRVDRGWTHHGPRVGREWTERAMLWIRSVIFISVH